MFYPIDVQVTDPDNHEANLVAANEPIKALGVIAFSDPGADFAAIDAFWRFTNRGRWIPYLEERGIGLRAYSKRRN